MENFNLPFGVRVSNDKPLDADRYVATTIAARDSIIANGRAYNGLQVFVEEDKTIYILTDITTSKWISFIPKKPKKLISETVYILKLEDVNYFLYFTANTDVTLIVPVGLVEDMEFHYMQRGDGIVRPVGATGVTVNVANVFGLGTATKFSPACLRVFSPTEVDAFGTLELA